jgi:hypothetical protein
LREVTLTTCSIQETRLVRVPFEHFYGATSHDAWKVKVYNTRQEISKMFGKNWTPIGPDYDENRVDNCVEFKYTRNYELPLYPLATNQLKG